MNPQFNKFNFNNPIYQQTWISFQQMLQNQQQIYQLQLQIQNLTQQMQQMIFYPQFKMYQQFCITRNLDPNDQNSFYLFYQQNFNETAPQPSDEKNKDTIRILITASSGSKVALILNKKISFSEMIRKYMDKIGIPFKHVEEDDLIFIYNAAKMNPFSEEPLSHFYKNDVGSLTVLDEKNIIKISY